MIDWLNTIQRAQNLGQELWQLKKFAWYWRLQAAYRLHQPLFWGYRSIPDDQQIGDPTNLTYGDTPVLTAYQIGNRLRLTEHQQWFEPGSGVGFSLITMHLAFGCQIGGIEFLEHRHRKAQLIFRSLGLDPQSNKTRLERGDFLNFTWPTEAYIYLTPTSWTPTLWHNVCEKLTKECPLATVLSLTQPIEAEFGWTIQDRWSIAVSWGRAEVYLHRRNHST